VHVIKDVISLAPQASRRLAIILPSFNDVRIADTIASIRLFDDLNTVHLIVIDGGSTPDVVEIIKRSIRPGDHFTSERDHGIFDALNKGLDACDNEFIGWLGSDDVFTGQVLASEVVRNLESNDLFVAATAVVRHGRITRLTHSLPSKWRLARFGLHNPHYSTFGRAELLKSAKFRIDHIGADIDYFLQIFGYGPRVAVTPRVCTLQGADGFSNASHKKIRQVNRAVFKTYTVRSNVVFALLAVTLKLCYKVCSRVYFKVFARYASEVMRP
jgi:glycosyltransferase involved in cell wall biosynthesis